MTQAATVGRAPAECPRTPETRGSAFEYFWRSRGVLLSSRLEQVRATLSRDGLFSQSIKMVALGHTHLPAVAAPVARGAPLPVVLNSGAWQRTTTPFQIEETIRDRGWSESEASPSSAAPVLLRQLQPEQLPACYGVIWIDPYTADPNPRFRFWRSDGRWGGLPRDAAGMANACGGGTGPPA